MSSLVALVAMSWHYVLFDTLLARGEVCLYSLLSMCLLSYLSPTLGEVHAIEMIGLYTKSLRSILFVRFLNLIASMGYDCELYSVNRVERS